MQIGNYIAITAAVISLCGATAAWWQASRATSLSTKSRIGDALLKVNELFIEDQDLWPYFFEGKTPIPKSQLGRAKAVATIMLNIYEEIWSQIDGVTDKERVSWHSYILHQIKTVDLLYTTYQKEANWYPNLQEVLEDPSD